MSDETVATASVTAGPAAPAAQAALALSVQELDADVSKLKKQVKAVWAAVIVIAVAVVAIAVFTLAPRMLGARVGGFQGRGPGFNPNQSQQAPVAPQQ